MAGFDSNYLLGLARQKSSAGRTELAATISDLFDGEGDILSDRERALMYEILHSVVKDAEMDVRKVISIRLADRNDAPSSLIDDLANDEIDVAYPILTESTLLHDHNLIDIIRTRTLEHQMAVTIRHSISEDVSDALVETKDERVIRSLLQNENASISEATMDYLVEQSERVDSFQEPVLHRKDLKPEMAKKMYMWVSAALRKYIVEQCDLDQDEVDDLIENVMVETLEGAETGQSQDVKSKRLAEALQKEGRISPDFMIRALNDGEVRLFVDLLSKATNLRNELVMRFVLEPGGEGLAVACKALHMSDYEFQRMFTLCRKARRTGRDKVEAEIGVVVKFYRQVTPEVAAEVVKRWRRDTSYLTALRDLNVI